MTPLDEQARALYGKLGAVSNYEWARQKDDVQLIAASLRQQWEDCANALEARMAPEGVSTDDMVWKFIEECRQRAKGGCQHEWGIDGAHSNEFCKKCFVTRAKGEA